MPYSMMGCAYVGYLFTRDRLAKCKDLKDFMDIEFNSELAYYLDEWLKDSIEDSEDFDQETKDTLAKQVTFSHYTDWEEDADEPESDCNDADDTFFLGVKLPELGHRKDGTRINFSTFRALPLISLHDRCTRQAELIEKVIKNLLPELTPSRPIFLSEMLGQD
jgi:hypothetical protein